MIEGDVLLDGIACASVGLVVAVGIFDVEEALDRPVSFFRNPANPPDLADADGGCGGEGDTPGRGA